MAVIPPDDHGISLPSLHEFGKGDLIKAHALATRLICDLSELEWAARTFVGDSPWGPGDADAGQRESFVDSLAQFASQWTLFHWELQDFMHTVSPELIAGRKRPVRYKGLRAACWALLPFEVLSQLQIFLLQFSDFVAGYIDEEEAEYQERARRSVGAFIGREFPELLRVKLGIVEKFHASINDEEAQSRIISEYVDNLLAELNPAPIAVVPGADARSAAMNDLDFESVTAEIRRCLTRIDLERLLFNVTAEFAAAARTRTLAGIPLSTSPSPPKRRVSRAEANVKARDYLRRNAVREQQGNPVGARELAGHVGCSVGLICILPVWRALVEEREKRRKSKTPDAVNLSDKVLATTGQQDEELNRLLADQRADFEPSPLDPGQHRVRERKRP
jgi:hypothetical protein